MSATALRSVAVAVGGLAAGLHIATIVMASHTRTEDMSEGAVWGSAFVVTAVIGSVIAARRPRNLVGWLLLVAGLGEVFAGAATLYGEYAQRTGSAGTVSHALTWVGGSMWAFSAAALLVFLPLYFPTGAPPTPRWRWVGWLGVAGLSLLLLSTLNVALFHPALMAAGWDAAEEALGDSSIFVLAEFGFPVLLGAGPLAVLSLVVRFFRSRGEERQQIKLLVYATTMTVLFVVVTNTDAIELPPLAEAVATAIALPSIGIATLVAILRYRLFDIDRLISRTLVYGALTILLVGIYLIAVTVLTWALSPVTRDAPFAVAAATLAAAAAFQPARRRIQSGVDRRFNRARYDAQQTLQGFAATMRTEVDLDQLQLELATVAAQALQPTSTVLWLRSEVRT